MSLTFTLSGTTSHLVNTFFPPIELDGEWEIGLLNLETYNSIPNLIRGWALIEKDKFHIPEGSYEIIDLERTINNYFGEGTINIKVNQNTLQTEINCGNNKTISLSRELREILGFTHSDLYFEPGVVHVSPNPAKISKINVIRVGCNIARGSYHNGAASHSIWEFYPSVPAGYRIVEVPRTVIYHSLNTSRIDTLTVSLLDQHGNLINFRGEEITIRVHLRRTRAK